MGAASNGPADLDRPVRSHPAGELLEQLHKAADRLVVDVLAHVDGRRANRGLSAIVVEAEQLRSAYNSLAPALGLAQDLRYAMPDPAALLREVCAGTPVLLPETPAPPVRPVVDDLTPRQVGAFQAIRVPRA